MPKYYLKTRGNSDLLLLDKKTYVRLFGILCFLVGIILFSYFIFPVISYQLFLAPIFSASAIESPIPKYLVVNENRYVPSLISQSISSLTSDYTDARSWYPRYQLTPQKAKINSYTISIPRLKIESADVSTSDYDLSKHLIQYAGTSIPGEKGTAIIFGHSTLPQLFDPKNYKAIFATLHTIKIGDVLNATVDGVTHKYKVFSINITNSEDTNIFSQAFDNSYITLVTCTPPGTVWKRLIVRASLDSLGD